jgi:hypothetical protein
MTLLCKIGIHKFNDFEVHYGNDYSKTHIASIIKTCGRCNVSKLLVYKKVVWFIEEQGTALLPEIERLVGEGKPT